MQQLPDDFFDSKADLVKYEKVNRVGKAKESEEFLKFQEEMEQEIQDQQVQEEEDLKNKEEEKRKDQKYEQEQYRKRFTRLKSLSSCKRSKIAHEIIEPRNEKASKIKVEADTWPESD